MKNDLKAGMAGFFKLEAVTLDSFGQEQSRRTCADWFPNLILDQGLDFLGSLDRAFAKYCQVGTGNTAPLVTDKSLAVWLAGQSGSSSNSGVAATPPYYGWSTFTYTFAIGATAGNLTEIGVGSSASGANLASRALILDTNGNPTAVTIQSDEQLVVTYQLRQYVPTSDVTGTVNISGVDYAFTLRAAKVTSLQYGWDWVDFAAGTPSPSPSPGGTFYYAMSTQTLGDVTTAPTGTQVTSGGTRTFNTYVPGSYYRDATWNLGPSEGTQDIGSVVIPTTRGTYQCSFTPKIPKNNLKSLSLTFRLSWARR